MRHADMLAARLCCPGENSGIPQPFHWLFPLLRLLFPQMSHAPFLVTQIFAQMSPPQGGPSLPTLFEVTPSPALTHSVFFTGRPVIRV